MSCLSFTGDKNSNKPKLTISNTQLNEDNQLGAEHPDVCEEEKEVNFFFKSLANYDVKKKKKKKKKNLNILKTIVNFHFKKENPRKNFRICCGIKLK